MSTLSGQKVKDKFGNLLHVEGGLTSSTKNVEDGTGDASALKLSTTEVEINGTQSFTSAPATDNSEATGLLINSSNEVVKRELSPIAFNGQEYPEHIFATVGGDVAVSPAGYNIAYAAVDNATDGASFHLYNGTDIFTFDNVAGTFRANADTIVKISGTFRTVVPTNNTTINYNLQLSTNGGSTWSTYNELDIIKSVGDPTAVQAHSFFGAFFVTSGNLYRILVTPSNDITLKRGTQIEFNRVLPQ